MEERRRFVRLSTLVKVEYAVIGKSSEELSSSTKNISLGGICLFLDDMVDMGTILELKMFIAQESLPINAMGKVVWIEEFGLGEEDKRKHIEAGIEFIRISDADRERLSQYIFKSLVKV